MLECLSSEGLGDGLDQVLALLDFESSREATENFGSSEDSKNAHIYIELTHHFRACWLAAYFCK